MSDYKFPELPSDEELGITDADRKEYEEDLAGDSPEMSDAELAALLGDSPTGAPAGAKKSGGGGKTGPSRADKRAEKRKAKEAAKRAKAVEKEAREAEKKAEAVAGEKAAEGKAGSTTSPPDGPASAEKNASDGPTRAEKRATKSAERAARNEAKAAEKQTRAAEKQEKAAARAAAVAEGPRSRWRGPATVALLFAISWVASSRTGLPRPVPANAPSTEFSSARAMSTLVDLARLPHPPGSPEHARVRDFIVERLGDLGIESEIQTATSVIQGGDFARSATVRNIVARIPGTASTGTVLITAHYDSREGAVGAGDDGSGVVAILESLRAIMEDGPLQNDLIVLVTDAEELGLLGAEAFVGQHPWMADVDLVLSFEMRGGGGPSIMFETANQNGWVVSALKEFDTNPSANSLSFEVYERMPNGTDFTPFKDAGVQGLNFAAIDNAHVYHQVYDTPDNLSEATLQHHGIHALASLRHFGQADLSEVNAPNLVYFTFPGLGLVTYSPVWVHLISIVLVLLWAGLFLVARRGGARLAGAAGGLGIAVVAGVVSWFAASTLLGWLPSMHDEVGSLHGSVFHSEGWYVLVMTFTSLGVVTGLVALTRRWLSLTEVMVGAIVLPLAGGVVLGFVAPLGAMNLQLPVLAALVAGIATAALGRRADSVAGWMAAIFLAAPVFFILQWSVELVWLALTLSLGGVVAVLITVGFLLCLPALEGLRHPNSWWAPVGSFALALACLGMGWLAARPNPDRPAPSTLVYAYEHGSGEAVWATSPSEEGRDLRARDWAIDAVGGPFEQTRDLTGFRFRGGVVPVRTAPVISARPPAVMIVSDSVSNGVRAVTLRVRSQIAAEMLAFEMTGGTRIQSINGWPLERSDEVRWVEHWGEPDGSVSLVLTMPPTEPINVTIVEHLLRPEELLGVEPFERPFELAPDITWLSDRAMFRYSVAAFVDPQYAIVQPAAVRLEGPAAVGAGSVGAVGQPEPSGGDSTGVAVSDSVGRTALLRIHCWPSTQLPWRRSSVVRPRRIRSSSIRPRASTPLS